MGGINLDLFLKTAAAFIFFVALYNFRGDILHSYKAYMLSIYLCVAYGIYQYLLVSLYYYFGFDIDFERFLAILPVKIWNQNYWHAFIVRDGMIRVPSFSLEPAYFNVFLAFALFIVLFFVRGIKHKKNNLLTVLFGMFMTYSRNAAVFLLAFFSLFAVYKRIPRSILVLVLALSYFLPILISSGIDIAKYDVSVFSRILPLKIFFSSEVQTVPQMIFGVNDIEGFMWGSQEFKTLANMPAFAADAKMLTLDPKSFVASLLYGFGLFGLCGFLLLNVLNFKDSKACLVLLSAFNCVIFNVNVIFWPVYWAFYVSLIVLKESENGGKDATVRINSCNK